MKNKGWMPEDTKNYSITASEANCLSNFLYKEQLSNKFLNGNLAFGPAADINKIRAYMGNSANSNDIEYNPYTCLLYTSDAADELDGVDLGGRRIIKKKFFQAEDGIRDRSPSRGLGDVYKRQVQKTTLLKIMHLPFHLV